MTPRPPLKDDLALAFTVLVWGLNIPIIKAALAVMHPHAMNVFRLSISAVVLGGLYVRNQRRAGRPLLEPLRSHGWSLLGLGLLGYVLYQFLFIVGIDQTTSGNAALIMASSPLWTAVLAHTAGFDVLRALSWIGLLLALLGAVVIVIGGASAVDFGDSTFFGNLLMVGAAACWGIYTGLNRPLSRHVSPIAITFFGVIVALPFLWALGLPYLGTVNWDGVSLSVWAAIVFSGGLSTGLAVALWNRAVQRVGATQTAVYGNMVPLIALVAGAMLLGETISWVQIAGGALILGGLLVMRRARRI